MRSLVAWSLLLGLVCTAGAADLPDAETILDRAIEATGGKAAHEKIHNRVSKGKMSMPAMGIEAQMTTYAAEPNKLFAEFESPALGSLLSGSMNDVHWEVTAMTGPRIKSGEEAAASRREADFDAALHWREYFETVETVGIDTVATMPCYKVHLVSKEELEETRYYDIEEYLLRKSEMTLVTEMGSIPIESYFTDYRTVDGIKMPFQSRQVIMGAQEMLFTTESVEHNVEIADETFAYPPDIEALLEKEGADGDE